MPRLALTNDFALRKRCKDTSHLLKKQILQQKCLFIPNFNQFRPKLSTFPCRIERENRGL